MVALLVFVLVGQILQNVLSELNFNSLLTHGFIQAKWFEQNW